jgi:RNA polymerase sigma-70 factor (ECF subfamily)
MAKTSTPRDTGDSDTSRSLINRLRQDPDDHATWGRFVDRYGPRILAWCRAWRVQDADAHDLTQIVLVELHARIRRFKYDPSRSFRGWLRRLTRNTWIASLRKKWPVVPGDSRIHALVEGKEAREDLVQRIEREFDLELLEEAKRRVRERVKPETYQAYELLAEEGLSGIEVSIRLKMSVTGVFVARHNVQKMLEEEIKILERRQRYR